MYTECMDGYENNVGYLPYSFIVGPNVFKELVSIGWLDASSEEMDEVREEVEVSERGWRSPCVGTGKWHETPTDGQGDAGVHDWSLRPQVQRSENSRGKTLVELVLEAERFRLHASLLQGRLKEAEAKSRRAVEEAFAKAFEQQQAKG